MHRVHLELRGDSVHNHLRHHHTLWATKSSKGRVAGQIRLTHIASRADDREVVHVIDVEEGSIHHRTREVKRPASVVVQLNVERGELALAGKTHSIVADEGMSASAELEIYVSIQSQTDGSIGMLGGHRGKAS